MTTNRRPSPAVLIALLALVVAMSGTAYAAGLAKNSVGSAQVKNNSLKGKDIKDDKLTGKDIKESTLVGLAPTAQPPVIIPTLEAGFSNFFPDTYSSAGYWKDTLGYVHLRGTLQCPTGENTAFVLPEGYRPARTLFMPLGVNNGGGGNLQVRADGHVRPYLAVPGTACGLDGVVFRADPPAPAPRQGKRLNR